MVSNNSEFEKPILTRAACAICVIIFLGLNFAGVPNSTEHYSRWGVSDAAEIRSGALWSLITANFAHVEVLHLIFNLYWLWTLGTVLEQTVGRRHWTIFFLILAVISTGAELTATGETGIGASGIVYGFFGYMWFAKPVIPEYARVVDARTVQLFVSWFFICLFFTHTGMLPVANFAHLGGLMGGILLAEITVLNRHKELATATLTILAAVSLLGLVWAPWTYSWTAEKAVKAFKNDDLKSAEYWTQRSLTNGADKSWSYDLLMRIATAASDKNAYNNALENFRKVDPNRADTTDKEMHRFWNTSTN